MDTNRPPTPRAARWFIAAVVAALPVMLCTASGFEASTPPNPWERAVASRSAESAVTRGFASDKSTLREQAGIASSLAAAMGNDELSAQERAEALATSGYRVKDGRVQLQIDMDAQSRERILAALGDLGAEITATSQAQDRLQAWIPLPKVGQVVDISGVYNIRRPATAHAADVLSVGSSTTEGVSVMNAAAWHTAGFTGEGVRVGIIDTGFMDYPGLLGSDLPAAVTVKNFVDGEIDPQVNGTSVHGTASAEIVHDVAPGADLYFAKVSTDLDLQEAMLWLKNTHHVDVITTSLSWFNVTPGDGTGEFANWVNQARSAGIFWSTAAGNYRENHWGGTFADSDADQYHNFGPYNETCLGPLGDCYLLIDGDPITLYLRWDDWTSVTQDYDLVLWRTTDLNNPSSFEIYDVSEDVQDGSTGQTPTEAIFTSASGADAFYLPSVYDFSSTRDVEFELISVEWSLEFQVHPRSLPNLADAPGAVTVAALDVWPPYLQEVYSSEGPTNGPGGTTAGGFVKPDLAAFANVSTESYGAFAFAGTSAATPHVAGAAALIKGAHPSYTPAQIQAYLETHAVDMGPPGMDSLYGYGRLLLSDPPHLLYLPLILR